MAVRISDLIIYGAANMPETDTAPVGGAVDFSKRISFSDIAPAGTMDYVSSSASDTAVSIALTYYDGAGAKLVESITLSGTTLVNGVVEMERVLKGVVSGTAIGDVAALSHVAIATGTAQDAAQSDGTYPAKIKLAAGQVASAGVKTGHVIRITNNTPVGVQNQLRRIVAVGTAGATLASPDEVFVNGAWATVPTSGTTYSIHEGFLFEVAPNQVTEIRRPFYEAVANGSGAGSKTFYEKVFAVNNSTADDLTGATVASWSADPSLASGVGVQLALCNALNDAGSASNRLTVPRNEDGSSLTFTSGGQPQTQAVPGIGSLTCGAAPNGAGAQGVWLALTLPGGTDPFKSEITIRLMGATQ